MESEASPGLAENTSQVGTGWNFCVPQALRFRGEVLVEFEKVLQKGTGLGLCSPAPARDREQEEQRGTVKESRIRDRNAARSTHVGRIHVKSSCQSKDQRESSADQPEPITYE